MNHVEIAPIVALDDDDHHHVEKQSETGRSSVEEDWPKLLPFEDSLFSRLWSSPQGIPGLAKGAYANLRSNPKLIIALVCFFITGIGANIFFKKELNALEDFPLFVTQLNPMVFTIFWAFPLAYSLWKKQIPHEEKHFPQKWIIFISFLDITANFLEIVGADRMGRDAGPLMLALAQAVIPFTLILSVFFLKIKYSKWQYFGAFVVLLGVVASLGPSLVQSSQSHTNSAENTTRLIFQLLNFSKTIPQAINRTFKNYLFLKFAFLGMIWLGFWEQFWEIPLGFAASLAIYPIFGTPVSEIPQDWENGLACVFSKSWDESSSCSGAFWLVLLFNFFGFLYGWSALAVVKYGSATLSFLATALMLPLSDLFFASSFVMGDAATHFSWWDIIGIFVIVSGLVVYGLGSSSSSSSSSSTSHIQQFEPSNEEKKEKERGEQTKLKIVEIF